MAKSKIHLKTREEFSALSLHEKNDYLQGVAQQIAHLRGEEFEPLGKDALSRIRRYYSRRSLADLKLEDVDRPSLHAALTAQDLGLSRIIIPVKVRFADCVVSRRRTRRPRYRRARQPSRLAAAIG